MGSFPAYGMLKVHESLSLETRDAAHPHRDSNPQPAAPAAQPAAWLASVCLVCLPLSARQAASVRRASLWIVPA